MADLDPEALLLPALMRSNAMPPSLLANASYCVLRFLLVDHAKGRDIGPLQNQCADLPGTTGEAIHLRSLCAIFTRSARRRDELLPDMIRGYAEWMEQTGLYEVALSYLKAVRLAVPEMDRESAGEVLFLEGRLNRLLARWDEADAAFRQMQHLGTRALELRGAMGRGVVMRHRGNLKDALDTFESITLASDTPPIVRAHGWANMSIVYDLQGRHEQATEAGWEAVLRYHQLESPLCVAAVSNVIESLLNGGILLHEAGILLEWAEQHARSKADRINIQIQQMARSALVGDQHGFRRQAEALAGAEPEMLPGARVDYRYRLGQGWAKWKPARGRMHLVSALALANEQRSHEAVARIERALEGVVCPPIADHDLAPLGSRIMAGVESLG